MPRVPQVPRRAFCGANLGKQTAPAKWFCLCRRAAGHQRSYPSPPRPLPYHGNRGDRMERKMFWIIFTVLSLLGYFMSFGWAIAEMFVALFASWWIVYRSGWI